MTRFIMFAALTLLAPSASLAQTIETFRDGESPSPAYAGTRDVTLDNNATRPWDPTANYDIPEMWCNGGSEKLASLLRWDLSSLPADAVVTGAQLKLTVTNPTLGTYEIYELLQAWSESAVSWNERALGSGWQLPGADRLGVDRDTTPLAALSTSSTGVLTVTFGTEGERVFQGWIANPNTNHGLVIQDYAQGDALSFHGSETVNLSQRPELILTYTSSSAPPSGAVSFRQGVNGYLGMTDAVIAHRPDPRRLLRMDGTGSPHASALVRFDLGSIPATATIQAATLLFAVALGSTDTYSVFEALRPWTESATWTTYDGSQLWQAPGAAGLVDRSTVVLGAAGPVPGGTLEVPLNPQGVAVIQAWASGERQNFGFVLQDYQRRQPLHLYDRESSVGLRPGLRLTYLPSANAVISPIDRQVRPGEPLVLDASASTPSHGASLTQFEWSQPEGPTALALSGAQRQALTFREPGLYRFRVRVSDSRGEWSPYVEARIVVAGDHARPDERLGCSMAPDALLGAAALLAFALLRRRPRF